MVLFFENNNLSNNNANNANSTYNQLLLPVSPIQQDQQQQIQLQLQQYQKLSSNIEFSDHSNFYQPNLINLNIPSLLPIEQKSPLITDNYFINGNSSSLVDPLTPPTSSTTNTTPSSDYFCHNRTYSLPSSLKLSNSNNNGLLRSTSFSSNTPLSSLPEQEQPQLYSPYLSNSNLGRFIAVNNNNNITNNNSSNNNINNTINNNEDLLFNLEHQFNQLSFDPVTPSTIQNSRRNTLFSNSSISSTNTSASVNSIKNNNSANATAANNNNNVNYKLDSTTDILSLSKDQHGCRFLQKKLDEDFAKNFPLIFNSIYKNSSNLMIDPFGNYLIQKLMILSSASEINLILLEITPNIFNIAINNHGTRALQKLIDCISNKNHHNLISIAIAPYIVELVQDLNGNHVIQKLINKFNGNELEFLIDLIIKNLLSISTHKHGCCVLQKLLNKCSNLQINKIGNEILFNCKFLMIDQFGNYVVQYLISLNFENLNNKLLNLVANNLVNMSCGKFSSNVVEKCLKLNNNQIILNKLVNQEILNILIRDQYGNYVVQTAIDISDWNFKVLFAELIKPILPLIRYNNFGKRIHGKVICILNEMANNKNNVVSTTATLTPNNNTINNDNFNGLLPGIEFDKFM